MPLTQTKQKVIVDGLWWVMVYAWPPVAATLMAYLLYMVMDLDTIDKFLVLPFMIVGLLVTLFLTIVLWMPKTFDGISRKFFDKLSPVRYTDIISDRNRD